MTDARPTAAEIESLIVELGAIPGNQRVIAMLRRLAPAPPTPQSDDQIQNLLTWLRGEGETEWVAAVEALAAEVERLNHEIEQQVKHRGSLSAEVERLGRGENGLREVITVMEGRAERAEEEVAALRTALQNAQDAYDYAECLGFIADALAAKGKG